MADYPSVTADYFNTMEIALRQGRFFDQREDLNFEKGGDR
jgi:hypothetical protein